MKVAVEKPGSPEEILHFGKKGMKWGVRQRYLASVQSRGARQRRVATGRGSVGDKAKTHLTTSNLSLIRAAKAGKPGFKGAALVRAQRSEAHAARIKAGKMTTHDLLRMAGSITMKDITGIGSKRK